MNVRSEPLQPYRSDEWRAQRLPFVTASNAAVMFGRHPYTTPGEYWTEKVNRVVTELEMTEAMERGHVLEEPVAQWWSNRSGIPIHQSNRFHMFGPLAATVDYLTDHDRPVEIKTTSQRSEFPHQYWLDQIQAQIACLDADGGHIVWFDGDRLRDEYVDRDDSFIAALYVKAEEFLAAVETGFRPEWVDLGAADVIALHPDPKGVTVIDDDMVKVLARFEDLKRDVKGNEVELSELKDQIANVFGDTETLTFDGATVATFKARKGNTYLDLDALVAAHPDVDLSKFQTRRPSTRVMSVKLPF